MCSAAAAAANVLPAVLAGVGHGSHLCAFYETKDDLIDLVLPFFEGGLRRDESCVWITPNSVDAQEAALHVRAAVAAGGIELYSARQVYLKHSHFESEAVVSFWNEKLQQALDAGRPGLRASGDAGWLQGRDWSAFLDYEADLTRMFTGKPMTLLCTYPLSMSKAGDLFDVACTHHLAIARRKKRWEVIKGWGIAAAPLARREKRDEALDAAGRVLSLSRRERQVLDRVAEGRPNKEISRDLGISVRTVEVHRAHLLDRLGVRTTAEAVRLATLASLITPP